MNNEQWETTTLEPGLEVFRAGPGTAMRWRTHCEVCGERFESRRFPGSYREASDGALVSLRLCDSCEADTAGHGATSAPWSPTRREVIVLAGQCAALGAVTGAAISQSSIAPPAAPPIANLVLWYDASFVDDVGDPDYVFWPNRGSAGGGMVLKREQIRRR